jgi:cell division protease FtsH
MFGSGVAGREHSDKVAADIDAEVSKIIENARVRAVKVLTENRKALDAIAEKLVEVETLEREDFEKVLIAHGITPKSGDGVTIVG